MSGLSKWVQENEGGAQAWMEGAGKGVGAYTLFWAHWVWDACEMYRGYRKGTRAQRRKFE